MVLQDSDVEASEVEQLGDRLIGEQAAQIGRDQ